MGGWQIGCFTRPWVKEEYTTAFDAIAEAGFKYCGFMTTKHGYIITTKSSLDDAAKAGEEAKKRGLGVLAAWAAGVSVAKGVEDGVAGLKHLIDNANAAACGTLLIGGTTKQDEYDNYYKMVAECCDYAAEKKVALVIKPHGGLNSTGEQCKHTVEKIANKNFHLWYDPGNIYYYSDGQRNPVDDAPSAAGVVSGMCVKDFKPPKNVDVTPGEGQVDFPKVFQALKAGGFTSGPLVIETLGPFEDPKQGIATAKRARELIEGIVAKL